LTIFPVCYTAVLVAGDELEVDVVDTAVGIQVNALDEPLKQFLPVEAAETPVQPDRQMSQ
jgi:hypothetical protein